MSVPGVAAGALCTGLAYALYQVGISTKPEHRYQLVTAKADLHCADRQLINCGLCGLFRVQRMHYPECRTGFLHAQQQYVKGLAHRNEEDAEKLARLLRQITGFLWNGNLHDGHAAIEDLVIDLEDVETDYASIKALRKAALEFETYITNNASMIPNYAERRRYGERVSTGFVESTVNTVVGKRFGKRQQMRWSKRGAHLMLQTRTRVLDGTLRTKFEQWHPALKPSSEIAMAA